MISCRKIKLSFFNIVSLFIVMQVVLVPHAPVFAQIVDGQNAFDLIGQYVQNDGGTVSYTDSTANDNSVNLYGVSNPFGGVIDPVNNRLFISDSGNNRVLVFNLNSSNLLVDKTPDFVLGQPNFYSRNTVVTQGGMNGPIGLAYDSTNQRLFVAQSSSNRVTVYDVTSITDGENAINVLGQTTFTSTVNATTQAGMSNPRYLAYDPTNQRLFVTQSGNHRVTVYDVTSITDGENAINVLGQPDFTSSALANTEAGMNSPQGLAYDSTNQRLFVTNASSHRVTIYDVTSITDGENAINVLGQTTFTGSGAANTQAGMNGPQDVIYDPTNQRLFVVQSTNNRVTVYDVTSITDGENAVNVLGQTTFTGATAATTQAGMNIPRGLAYDSTNQRLFVTQGTGNRVTIYDVTSITDGENAIDLMGQYVFNDGGTVSYTDSTANDAGVNPYGLSSSFGIAIDSVNNRLFISDSGNNRVLVFNLNSSNLLVDKTPDFVLGQPNFYSNTASTTQAGMSSPRNIAYDSTNQRLFVTQSGAHRVTVYDVTSITDGENAVNVLGQPDFTSSALANTQAGMNSPFDVAYDGTNQRLFVAQTGNHRVTVYDVTSITDGENAVNVLGQTTFTGATAATTQAGMNIPRGLAYDPTNQRLFVSQDGSRRVTVYDVTSITDGENAINVLGQTTFTGSVVATTQAGINGSFGLTYDSTNQRLFLAQGGAHRVTVYDVTSITDGENAINVLGQTTFTGSGAANTQAGMNGPSYLTYDSINHRLFVVNSSSNRVTVYDVSTNPNYSISGTVYSDEGIINIGSGKTVRILVNGLSVLNPATTDSSGAYSFPAVATNVGHIISVHLDGVTEKGVVITKQNGANITGLDIYQDELVINDTSDTITKANIITGNDADSDITSIYSTSGVVAPNKTLYIASGTDFTPGLSLDSDGSIKIVGTLNAGANTVSIGKNFINEGVFTHTSGTALIFDGGVAQIFNPGSSSIGSSVLVSGASTAVTLSTNPLNIGSNTLTIDNANGSLYLNGQNLTIGTLNNTGTLRVQGGETVSMATMDTTNGTYEYVGDGDGLADTFNINDFGTTDYFSLKLNATDANDIFNAPTTMTIAGNFTNNRGFTHNGGEVLFSPNVNHTLFGSTTWNNLTFSESSNDGTSSTITFPETTIQTIEGTFTLNGLDNDDLLTIISSGTSGLSAFISMIGASVLSTSGFLSIKDNEIIDNSSTFLLPVNPQNSINVSGNKGWFSGLFVNMGRPFDNCPLIPGNQGYGSVCNTPEVKTVPVVINTSNEKCPAGLIFSTVTGARCTEWVSESELSCNDAFVVSKPVSHTQKNKNNKKDVIIIQKFLNTYEDANLKVDGIYGLETFRKIVKWQEKNAESILKPWGLKKGTGYIFTTSIAQMKKQQIDMCNTSETNQ